MYLLDTDILSNLMRRSPSSALVARVARVPPEEQHIEHHAEAGVRGASAEPHRTAKIEDALLPNLPVLAFDTAAARRYGEIRAELERLGTPIGDTDMRIAAMPSRTGQNRATSARPELEIENWLEG